MIVELDSHTAVVQKRGDFEHSDVNSGHLVKHFELFEKLYREVVNVFRVRDIEVVILHLRVNGVSQNVRKRSFVDARHCIAEHCTLSQTATADCDFLEIEARKHRFHNGKRAREDVRASARKSLDLHRAVEVEFLYGIVDVFKLGDGQFVIVRHVERIFLDKTADSAEVSETSAHTDKRRIRLDTVKPGDFFKLFADEVLDLLCALLRRGGIVFEQIRKRNRAERQGFEMD